MKSPTAQDLSVSDPAPVETSGTRLWALAVLAGVLLITLAIAFGFLLTARKKTVDALVIITIPSGATVELDGKQLGPSPVTLEDVKVGQHVVSAEKDGFVTVEREINVGQAADDQVELLLKPVAPPGSVAHTVAERVAEFAALAEDAFSRGDLVVPSDRSALYYADAVWSVERGNAFASEMRKRIRMRLLTDAKAAEASGDLARAKTLYVDLEEAFPGDAEINAGMTRIDNALRKEKSRLQEYLRDGRNALRSGRLIDPDGKSALDYAERALAIDGANSAAIGMRKSVRDRTLEQSSELVARGQIEQAADLLRRLVSRFPRDRSVRGQYDGLMAGRAGDLGTSHRDAGMKSFAAGNYRAAADQLESATRLGVADAQTHAALGQAYLKLGNTQSAKRELERAVRQGFSSADVLATLGGIYESEGARQPALNLYRRAIKIPGSTLATQRELQAAIDRLTGTPQPLPPQ